MGNRLADPPKNCVRCGRPLSRKRYSGVLEDMGVFLRRKFCDRTCMGRAFVKDAPSYDALSKRGRKFLGTSCESCGGTMMLSAHHIDGNRKNNSPENIQTLCVRCHSTHHHRVRRAGMATPGRMALAG
ncbi:MAG: HNH endonuclease [Planctomycetes bacterium]|nr:HNH endonuclease [Planctomycetota bacterium]